jgi:hypothetical protein
MRFKWIFFLLCTGKLFAVNGPGFPVTEGFTLDTMGNIEEFWGPTNNVIVYQFHLFEIYCILYLFAIFSVLPFIYKWKSVWFMPCISFYTISKCYLIKIKIEKKIFLNNSRWIRNSQSILYSERKTKRSYLLMVGRSVGRFTTVAIANQNLPKNPFNEKKL